MTHSLHEFMTCALKKGTRGEKTKQVRFYICTRFTLRNDPIKMHANLTAVTDSLVFYIAYF